MLRFVACLLLIAAAAGIPPALAQPTSAEAALVPQLPAPSGPRQIAVQELRLVDPRPDPWKPEARRELMVSVWYPAAAGGARAPYMRAGAAKLLAAELLKPLGPAAARVDLAAIRTHAAVGGGPGSGRHPVVIYSPGGNQPRAMGTALVEDLASRGYVVVTLDHTGEPSALEFPDGRVMGNIVARSDDRLQRMLETRVADVRFVIEALHRLSRGGRDADGRALPQGLGRGMDLGRLGVFGHSAGGFTALQAMAEEPRIRAAANLDGSLAYSMSRRLYGPVVSRGLDRPFLLMGAGTSGSENKPHTHEFAPEWKALWENSSGWKRDIYLAKAEHMAFNDQVALLPQVLTGLKLPAALASGSLGALEPARSLQVQRAYLAAFFDQHLRGRPQPLFTGEAGFPEAQVIP